MVAMVFILSYFNQSRNREWGKETKGAVKKTTSQNVWPRINSLIKTARSTVLTRAIFFFRRQPRNPENVTLVARRREHFRVCLAIFLTAQIPPKRGVLVHKNSLASYQQCRRSVESRAQRYPFKHSELIAWSLLS